jgi:hypothetical protein
MIVQKLAYPRGYFFVRYQLQLPSNSRVFSCHRGPPPSGKLTLWNLYRLHSILYALIPAGIHNNIHFLAIFLTNAEEAQHTTADIAR